MPERHRSRRDMTIVLAEDDEDDRERIREVLAEKGLEDRVHSVADGRELLEYLHRSAEISSGTAGPAIILLDLNMPRMDGREALAEIKAERSLRAIPVIVLTNSRSESDVESAYRLGASSFITKPVDQGGLEEVIDAVLDYWFDIVHLPSDAAA